MILAMNWPAMWCRFDALQRWPWVVAVALFATVLSRWFRSGGSSPAAVFRLLAIVCILTALMEPVISRPRLPAEAGTIVLMLDASRSMTVHDRLRTPKQRIALARALGRLPPAAENPAIDMIRRSIDRLAQRVQAVLGTRSELDYARMVGRRSPEARGNFESAVVQLRDEALDVSHSVAEIDPRLASDVFALAGAGAGPGPAREAWVGKLENLLQAVRGDFDRDVDAADELQYRTRPEIRRACDTVADLSRVEIERLAAQRCANWIRANIAADMPIRTSAFGNGVRPIDLQSTDLEGLARSSFGDQTQLVAAARDDIDGPVLASAIFSDGRPAGDQTVAINRTANQGWPVFTMRVAPAGTIRDVSVTNVSAPSWAYRGETVYIRAQLQSAGLSSRTVKLRCDLGENATEQSIDAADNLPVIVRPSVVADNVGPQTLQLSAIPEDGGPIEGAGSIARPLRVVDRTVRVALLDNDDPATREILSNLPFVQLAEADDDLDTADVIIVGDSQQAPVTVDQWASIRRRVQADGAGVVFLGTSGYRMAALAGDPAAAPVVPWTPRTRFFDRTPVDRQMVLQPAGVEAGPLFDGLELTSFMQSDTALPNTSSLLIDSITRSPVLVEKRIGAGRALLLSIALAANGSTDQADSLARLWSVIVRNAASPPVMGDMRSATPASTEMDNLTGRSDVLRRIARNTGGAFAELDDLDTMLTHLKSAALAPRPPVEWRLSTGPQLFAFIVGCLTIDWSLRKRAGLS